MQRTLSRDLPARAGHDVRLEGWVHRRRELAKVSFLILRDRTGLAQVVLPAGTGLPGEETVVEVTGRAVANPVAPGGVEVVEPAVRVLGEAERPPVELFRPSLDAALPTLLDHAAVTLRHPGRRTVFAAASAAMGAFRATLGAAGFTEIATPKIVASATESGANVFAIDYFGRPAYLAQSPQFYKQTMVGVFERVFEVGPVFRAEPHDTSRHLATYTSLDVEFGFIADHRDVMALLRDVLAGMLAAVAPLTEVPEMPAKIPSVHFTTALELVGAALGEDLSAEPDLAPAH